MIKLYNDDCFNVFPTLEDKSIDLVLCDMPYGTTACKWDTVLDLELVWKHIKRIAKHNAAIVLFCRQPFTTLLINSNLKEFRYSWFWVKTKGTNYSQAKYRPLDNLEDVAVFSKATASNGSKTPMKYYPQGLIEINKQRVNSSNPYGIGSGRKDTAIPPHGSYIQKYTNYPNKLLYFKNDIKIKHPTQKPVALVEYLIKTYSNEGDIVLDFCMGSGTTGVACKNLNRKFIGIELLKEYYDIAERRINEI